MSGSGLLDDGTATKRAGLVREQGEELFDAAHHIATTAREMVEDGITGRNGEAANLATVATALTAVGSALLVESRALRDEASL